MQYPDQYEILSFSLGILRGISIPENQNSDEIPNSFSDIISEKFPNEPVVKKWKEFRDMFSRTKGLWDRPLILLIDEVDTLPSFWLDVLVGQFREMYLDREANWLHALSLIGVRAVLGVDSERGSPFNIQRSLHVPNFTLAEVTDLFNQYQLESGQVVEPEVVGSVYESTNGQPGLVGWFGELLTENKSSTGVRRSQDGSQVWHWALGPFHSACLICFHNAVLKQMQIYSIPDKFMGFLFQFSQIHTGSSINFIIHNS